MSDGDTRAKVRDKYAYLKSLTTDPRFIEYVLEPLDRRLVDAQKRLETGNALHEVCRAQGELRMYSFFDIIFARAEKDIESLEKQERSELEKKEQANGNGRTHSGW